jgi:hypothetical protein
MSEEDKKVVEVSEPEAKTDERTSEDVERELFDSNEPKPVEVDDKVLGGEEGDKTSEPESDGAPPPDVKPDEPEKVETDPDLTNEESASLRVYKKTLEEKVDKKIEEGIAKALESRKEDAAHGPTEGPKAERASADDVLTYMVRAMDGKVGTPQENAQIEALARKALSEELSSTEIAGVLKRALGGGFGDMSEDIAEIAQRYAPIAMAREAEERNRAAESDEAERTEKTAYHEELQQVASEHPALIKQDSAETKHVLEWDRVYLGEINPDTGKIVTPGVYDQAMVSHILKHPAVHARLAMQSFGPSKKVDETPPAKPVNPEVAALKAQIAKLEEKDRLSKSPEDTGSQGGGDEKKTRTSDVIEQELLALNGSG